MPNEHQLSLCQTDQARTDFAAIESHPEGIQVRFVLLATRKNLSRVKVLATARTAALVSAWIEALPR
jgi:hypothetical protein